MDEQLNIIKLNNVGDTCVKVMKQYNLDDWTFAWHNRRSSHGTCNYTKKIILLSKPNTIVNSIETIYNTILHEVAHARLPAGVGHGYEWKKLFIEMGGNGERTTKSLLRGKYQASCPTCGRIAHRDRAVKCRFFCPDCFKGQYTDDIRFTFIKVS